MATAAHTAPLEDRELLASAVRIPAHVVHRAFPNETVVLNLNTGRYHGLNVTAGRMLATLEGAETVRQAAGRIAQEYRRELLDVRRDLCRLCRELIERDLLEIDVAGRP